MGLFSVETAWHYGESLKAPSESMIHRILHHNNVTGLSDIVIYNTKPSSKTQSPDCQRTQCLVEVCVPPGKASVD